MNKISLNKGRVKQKSKTRNQILNSAQKLMSNKGNITLEEVAEHAQVSRATIYRYFPNINLLCSEASLDINFKTPEILNDIVAAKSLNERIHYIQNYYNTLALEQEVLFRRYLITVLNESLNSKNTKIRGARRVEAMSLVLTPFKEDMEKQTLENLKNISTILMGIDSLITAKDVCGLSNKEANSTLKWGIEMILKGIQCK
jgi:AcrR family transcriptional regulator